ncbi:MAG: transglutaminase-like domain-containing protein [Dysgonamonadaceae bacterium]|jgi:hypothetical protein|nr:transglutaminase-like domain-containing protein [Dysgonamonadaceae bacterium]
MKQLSILSFLAYIGLTANLVAQQPLDGLKVIRAKTNSVDIRIDGKLLTNAWRIVPSEKPDIFNADKNELTFITDIDSITVKVNFDETYDFIILLNEKDSAWTQVKRAPDYLARLKKAKDYNFKDKRFIPKFTYQSADYPYLKKIKKQFCLDSIAGYGNETLKIINLMRWVHNTIRHDGGSMNPDLKNTFDIIEICKTENRGVNCRMMAQVLNECYLAMGFKSRYITCMPKDSVFDDCHVINMVWSNDLKKWLYMDPTNDAYVMNEKGELLSIEEVRERLINGKPLILNPDANWNNKISKTKEDYLERYMAKNLYRLETPVRSEYDTETYNESKTVESVELLPLDALQQTPQKVIISNNWINYKTNNPALFWAEPDKK